MYKRRKKWTIWIKICADVDMWDQRIRSTGENTQRCVTYRRRNPVQQPLSIHGSYMRLCSSCFQVWFISFLTLSEQSTVFFFRKKYEQKLLSGNNKKFKKIGKQNVQGEVNIQQGPKLRTSNKTEQRVVICTGPSCSFSFNNTEFKQLSFLSSHEF